MFSFFSSLQNLYYQFETDFFLLYLVSFIYAEFVVRKQTVDFSLILMFPSTSKVIFPQREALDSIFFISENYTANIFEIA